MHARRGAEGGRRRGKGRRKAEKAGGRKPEQAGGGDTQESGSYFLGTQHVLDPVLAAHTD